ncbi:MAG TPA: hypothetical protein VM223_07260, partial [Planctomycetota bacterium]|nr:hypothetical protein [Planctomycetota bacterium]
MGTPEDNPLIKFLLERGYLPYRPVKEQVPGRGRGLIAWQCDGIRFFGGESITLIAYDEQGMSEAVGTLYEAATGMEPLTPMALPADVRVSPSPRGISIVDATRVREPSVDWQMNFP